MSLQRFKGTRLPVVPPKGGMVSERSNATPMARKHGIMWSNCDHCGLEFNRAASHLRRRGSHYCSRGCQWDAKRVRINKACIVCGELFGVTPTNWFHIVTCSKPCASAWKRARPRAKTGPLPLEMCEGMLALNCPVCGKLYVRARAHIKRYAGHYCSRACHGAAKHAAALERHAHA